VEEQDFYVFIVVGGVIIIIIIIIITIIDGLHLVKKLPALLNPKVESTPHTAVK
jgi:hypothetical protein